MGLIWAAVVGLVAGALAKLIMPGKDPGGIIVTMLLGIGGAIAATMLGRTVGLYDAGESAGLIAAVVGAILILAIYRWFVGRKAPA